MDAVATLRSGNGIGAKGNMSRNRFVKGGVFKKNGVWYGRYQERVIEDGKLQLKDRKPSLGSCAEMTRAQALRALNPLVQEVNDRQGKARQSSTFASFVARWEKEVLVHTRLSHQASEKSIIKQHLVPAFGQLRVEDISGEHIQQFVTASEFATNTISNHLGTLRRILKTAKGWGYIKKDSDPFFALAMPEKSRSEEPFFTAEQMRLIVQSETEEPFKSIWWILAETGMRGGEVIALSPESLNLVGKTITVLKKGFGGKIEEPKTKTGRRQIHISSALAEHLSKQVFSHPTLLFPNEQGKMRCREWLIRGNLQPLLERLEIPKAGGHAFRHGNATVMGELNIPEAAQIQRIGHAAMKTTRGYTHVRPEVGAVAAEAIGKMITEVVQ